MSLSAGLLKVSGDLSVTSTASGAVQTTSLTANSVTATTVNAPNFNTTHITTDTLTVNGNLNFENLNYTLGGSVITNGVNVPYLLTVDSSDNLYSSNYGSNSITIYNPSGTLINTITNRVYTPAGVAVNPVTGNIYVANYPNEDDTSGNNITVYDPSGILINTFGHSSVDWPNAITFGPDGYLYVPNLEGSNVTVYDVSGVLVKTLTNSTMTGPYSIIWGSDNQTFSILNNPGGLGVPNTNNITIYDLSANPIQTITDGVGGADAMITSTINGVYNIYVSNYNGNQVSVYSEAGVLVNTITEGMNSPVGMAINSQEILFVGNLDNNTIKKYTITFPNTSITINNNGNKFSINVGTNYIATTPVITTDVSVPYLITVDSSDNLYSSNYGSNSITIYNSSGTLINTITNRVYTPAGVAINPVTGNIYVANYPNEDDTSGNNITVYDPSGILINTFGHSSVDWPNAITFGPDGYLYVPNLEGSNVTVYDVSGVLVKTLTNSTMTGPYSIIWGSDNQTFSVLNNPGGLSVPNTTNFCKYDLSGNLLQVVIDGVGGCDAMISATINGIYNIYVSNYTGNQVSVYSEAGVLVNTIVGGMNGPCGLVFNNSQEILFVGNVNGTNNITPYTLGQSSSITVGGVTMSQSQWNYLVGTLLLGR